MKEAKQKLWTKNFIILSTLNFLLTLVFFLLNATITVFALNEFNASPSQGGLVSGIFIIGALISRLFTGRIVNSVEPKKILIIGLILFTLTTLLYFADYGITFLILSRFLHGVALGIASTVLGTIVALIIPGARKGEGIGYYAVSTALATGFGPFIGLYMNQHTSFDMIFSLCFLLAILSLLVALFFFNVPNLKMEGTLKISSFIEPKALPISMIILTMTFSFSAVLSYLNIYAIEIDLVDAASFFFVLYSVAVLISRPFTGRLMDRKGANFIMYPAITIYGAGMLLLGSAGNSVTLLLAGAMIGIGFGNISSITQTIAVNAVEPHRVGLATSTFLIFFEMGTGTGPYLLGLVIQKTGYSALYAILGVFIFAISILYYFLHGKKEHQQRVT
ncbi:MFS transporter [Paenibacillus sp. IHBB 3054]|uniref:MFS transporter n=1 Tax=Paenibacillus sp. IHBB 3054 TaxID=3425689 RepID=UPI003F67A134